MQNMRKYLQLQFLITCAGARIYTEDYFWRDYEGVIPTNALPAHRLDRIGKPVFIGQALFDGKLIPGKIDVDDGNVYFELFEKEYSTNENIKILCCQQREKLELIQANRNALHYLRTNKLLVKGGFEPNCESYIGRVEMDGQMHPGKVICFKVAGILDHCFGLFTTNNGTTQLHSSYEILGYSQKPVASSTGGASNAGTDNDKCKQISISYFN